MADLVVIEDSTVMMMLQDGKFAAEIPCLMNKIEIFRNNGGGCGSCARKRQVRQRDEMAKIKACLAALSPEKKTTLKQLLDANKVRVTYAQPGGKIVQLTF